MNKLDVVTVFDVSMCFGIGTQAVMQWVRTGALPKPRMIGDRTYWDGEELRKFLGLSSQLALGEIHASIAKMARIIGKIKDKVLDETD